MPVWEARHFNAISKEIRELFPTFDEDMVDAHRKILKERSENMVRRGVLSALALSLAHRFEKDNPGFKPEKFLSACSPDNERFPLAELWEDEYADKGGM